jgi:hypothetical protein
MMHAPLACLFLLSGAASPLIPEMANTVTHRDAAQLVAFLPWGTALGQAAHALPEEGAPEAPKAIGVDAYGRIHLLDQLNGRIQVILDGKVLRTLPVATDTFEDLAVLPNGDLVLLDRFVARALVFVDAAGREFSRVPLEGPSIPEAGLITALRVEGADVLVEVEHAQMVRVASVDGSPDLARDVRQGRAAKDGTRWTAGLDGPFVVNVSSSPVAFPVAVDHVTALEPDARGRVLLAVSLMVSREVEPFDVVAQEDQLVVLSSSGKEQQRFILPSQSTPEDVFHPITLGADGRVYALVCTTTGLQVWGVTP